MRRTSYVFPKTARCAGKRDLLFLVTKANGNEDGIAMEEVPELEDVHRSRFAKSLTKLP